MKENKYRYDIINTVLCQTLTIQRLDDIHYDLIENGLLDSLALVSVMVAIEEEFNITIPTEELNIEDFRSIHSIDQMIERLVEVAA